MAVSRLAQGLLTLLAASALIFAGTELLPGDVATAVLGQSATPEAVQELRQHLGLDQPAATRYVAWLSGVLQGDLGRSLANGRAVSDLIAQRLPNTLLLAGTTAVIAMPLALALGALAAVRAGSAVDRSITAGMLLLISGPEFLFASALVIVFAVLLQWLPAVSLLRASSDASEIARALVLPVATLTCSVVAPVVRMTRASLLNVLAMPSIETVLLKGATRRHVILHHALPNAISPILNIVAINLAYLLTSVIVVEVVFAYPGMAKLMVDGVGSRDIPVVQACALYLCTGYILLNLIADLLAILANPRLRRMR